MNALNPLKIAFWKKYAKFANLHEFSCQNDPKFSIIFAMLYK